jgi:hypothetical protein
MGAPGPRAGIYASDARRHDIAAGHVQGDEPQLHPDGDDQQDHAERVDAVVSGRPTERADSAVHLCITGPHGVTTTAALSARNAIVAVFHGHRVDDPPQRDAGYLGR